MTPFRGTATYVHGRIVDVGTQPGLPPFPSEGGAPIAEAGATAWIAAAAAALALIDD